MTEKLRVAFFADSYLELNGAAMTCRRLVDFASNGGYPFLCIHGGDRTHVSHDRSVTHLSLKRGPVKFTLNEDLACDPFFQRDAKMVRRELEHFRPDVIHITGLNDVSIIGVYLAWKMQIPMVGSWHTNIHEFASQRLKQLFRFMPSKTTDKIAKFAEKHILAGSILYYKMPKVVLSPNAELVELLDKGTGRTSRIMLRGVDTQNFSPAKRTVNDGVFRIGYVGRLRPEKNVRLLADIEKKLLAAGKTNFQFMIVGDGSEREFLERTMSHVDFTGFISGESLSNAYANMDVFVFPSETDAFGNVTQEASASGVPAIVSNLGGPKFLIEPGKNGFICQSAEDFAKFTIDLMEAPEKLAEMKIHSRNSVMSRSWDAVFDGVYEAYAESIALTKGNEASKQVAPERLVANNGNGNMSGQLS